MDVQHAARPCLDQERRQQPHIAGQADDLDPGGAQRAVDCDFMRRAVAAERAMGDHRHGHSGRGGEGKTGCLGTIGNDQLDASREIRILGRREECLKV